MSQGVGRAAFPPTMKLLGPQSRMALAVAVLSLSTRLGDAALSEVERIGIADEKFTHFTKHAAWASAQHSSLRSGDDDLDVDLKAAAGEDEDDTKDEGKQRKQNTPGENDTDSDGEVQSRVEIPAALVDSEPALAPYEEYLTHADEVAHDMELRLGASYFTEGSSVAVDMDTTEKYEERSIFTMDPSVFKHCILIRDFAMPLRVGNALVHTGLRGAPLANRGRRKFSFLDAPEDEEEEQTKVNKTKAATEGDGIEAGEEAEADTSDQSGNGKEEDDYLPAKMLTAEGAISDRAVPMDSMQDGESVGDAELTVNMFAYLRSVAGQVAVVPSGDVGKWSSKQAVPIAGYLCTPDDGPPVLHSLPTPCVATSLDDDGMPMSPPPVPPVRRGPVAPQGSTQPGPHELSDTEAESKSEDLAEQEAAEAEVSDTGDAEAAAQEAEQEAATAALFQKNHYTRRLGSAPAPGAASSPGPIASPAAAPAPPPQNAERAPRPFVVYVGSNRLEFSSKPKAERFCKRLTKKIADDMGDTRWDGAEVAAVAQQSDGDEPTVNPSVTKFVQVARRRSESSWTLGTKKLLVVVMDWMRGDRSRAPLSSQTKSPSHYEDRIFPRVKRAFQAMSNGKFDLDITVVPEVIPYTRPRSRYTAGGYPFPGLYNGAKQSLEGNARFGRAYSFDSYDLVYVISPQQAPTGTKGVAWVGAKGAICNGCEEISENFQVMVAVHELGHNLGLWHASSKSLEYGNVFDWMGNYPDVHGLSYGLGYKMKLGWVPHSVLHTIRQREVGPSLSDRFFLRPFDLQRSPRENEVLGIQVQLPGDVDLYIAYRHAVGEKNRGVFLTLQDKDKPNSELVDCACHTPSQQDARLQPGWTYLDPTKSVVVYVEEQHNDEATVLVFAAPENKRALSAIRGRSTFTDGQWKCPRTCTDSDLLVSQYSGCPGLARDGYCKGGSITMGGVKMSIGKDLCPQSCRECNSVMSGSTLKGGGCEDRNMKISGKSCRGAASAGYCSYDTNVGNVGRDLCPQSCGKCPARPESRSSGTFENPLPSRTWGTRAMSEQEPAAEEDDPEVIEKEQEEEEKKEEEDAERADAGEEEREETTDGDEDEPGNHNDDSDGGQDEEECADDPAWTDADGDGCEVYATYIKSKALSREEACNYGESEARAHCRSTCNTCSAVHSTSTCRDKICIVKWKRQTGTCFACKDSPAFCNETFFANDCPATCGKCVPRETTTPKPTPLITTSTTTTTRPPTEPPTPIPPVCEDADCVESWQQEYGNCWSCRAFGDEYCGSDAGFRASCPRSCKLCQPDEEPTCEDNFQPHTCKRYRRWGWCSENHISDHCKSTCGVCAAQLELEQTVLQTEDENKEKSGTDRHSIHPSFVVVLALTLYRHLH